MSDIKNGETVVFAPTRSLAEVIRVIDAGAGFLVFDLKITQGAESGRLIFGVPQSEVYLLHKGAIKKDESKADELKVGEIVTLKSGSPDMTVVKLTDGTVHLAWFCYEISDFKYLEASREVLKYAAYKP